MRKVISCLAVVILAALLLPVHAVTASTSSQATGQITVGRQPATFVYTTHTSEALEVYASSALDAKVETLTPQVTYYVKATVNSPNTLADLDTVKVIIHYHIANESGSGDISTSAVADAQKVAILTCTNAGSANPTWSIDAGASTTWSIVSDECSKPAPSASSGSYVFAFKPGKVATNSPGGVTANNGFALFASVKNKGNTTNAIWYTDSDNHTKKGIQWYGEVTGLTPTISWTNVNPGTGFADNINEISGLTVTYITNGNYKTVFTPSNTWTGTTWNAEYDTSGTGACSNDGEFAIQTERTGDFAAATLLVRGGSDVNLAGVQSPEAGNTVTNGTMWLKVAPVFPVDTYSGTITFTIATR